jgi:hypothetical protein
MPDSRQRAVASALVRLSLSVGSGLAVGDAVGTGVVGSSSAGRSAGSAGGSTSEPVVAESSIDARSARRNDSRARASDEGRSRARANRRPCLNRQEMATLPGHRSPWPPARDRGHGQDRQRYKREKLLSRGERGQDNRPAIAMRHPTPRDLGTTHACGRRLACLRRGRSSIRATRQVHPSDDVAAARTADEPRWHSERGQVGPTRRSPSALRPTGPRRVEPPTSDELACGAVAPQ